MSSASRPKRARKAPATVPIPLKAADLTDLALAGRFVDRNQGRVRYCPDWKAWLVYDGRRWRRSSVEHEHLAKETVGSLRAEAGKVADPFEQLRITTAILRCESAAVVSAILKLSKSDPAITVAAEALDKSPLVLNVLNGSLDLETGELRPHRPEDLLSRVAPVEYHPEAACPTWLSFLDRVMAGDKEMIGYLQRLAGYSLSGSVEEHAMFWGHGTGRNGKSLLLKTLMTVLGDDYSITAANHLLTATSSPEHSTGLADLEGKRLVAIAEPPSGRIDENLVKSLTGGENVRARRMHQDNREFRPTHKLFVAANHKPAIQGNDDGIWSRIRMILFPVSIPPDQQDKVLDKKLAAESQGILAWMVQGCLAWQREGLQPPQGVIEATRSHREDSDPVAAFLGDRCDVGQSNRCGTTELFRAYEYWCSESSVSYGDRLDAKKFGQAVETAGFKRLKSSGVMTWVGLKVRPIVE